MRGIHLNRLVAYTIFPASPVYQVPISSTTKVQFSIKILSVRVESANTDSFYRSPYHSIAYVYYLTRYGVP